jgi:hypothetical protein
MNCKQVQELLPLYASHDLEERREQLVAAHIQSCAECAGAADEYRETRQLLQDFASPAFSEGVYAGIRQRVLREIEAESTAPPLPQLLASLFRPRLTWAVASALLIVISLFAIYFVANWRNDQHELTDKSPATVQPPVKDHVDPGSQHETQAARPSPSNERLKDERLVDARQPRKKSRDGITESATNVAAIAPDAKSTAGNTSTQTNNLPERLFPAHSSAASEKTLRVEIQTKDPNIRIIWFSQQEPKPVVPNSKGI